MTIEIAFLQDDFPELDRDGNRARVTRAAEDAAARGCDVLALPELWCSGYDLARVAEVDDWEREFEFLADLSRDTGLAILGGSLLEPVPGGDAGKFYNCAVVFDRGAELARYRKAHLFAPLGEDRFLEPGPELPTTFDVRGVRCALSVCYDLRFPELYRQVVTSDEENPGIDLLFVPAQWPMVRVHHWRTLLIARAIENQCFVLGVNRRGKYGEVEFGGNSLLVDPWGGLTLDARDDVGLLTTSLDPTLLADAKKKLPTLPDRRTDLYP
ncbi:MAG: nitrilase-related carbon-nitrogen hydrolase [Planctomycetota bacterium]